jgi:hypothetical protein
METTGILKLVGATTKVSDKFQKREFVLTTEANTPYPQHVQFQVTQDKCSVLDSYNVGEEVKIQFNLRGREWNGPEGVKYFNTLEAWRIERAGAAASQSSSKSATQTSATAATATQPASASAPIVSSPSQSDEDLPF